MAVTESDHKDHLNYYLSYISFLFKVPVSNRLLSLDAGIGEDGERHRLYQTFVVETKYLKPTT